MGDPMRSSTRCARVIYFLVGASLCVACGRKATPEDCQAIVDRNVEIQMKQMSITDPAAIEKKKTEMRTALEGDLRACVGRRVSDKMMECVRQAQKADEIDQCIRAH